MGTATLPSEFKTELMLLFEYIQKVKHELAAIRHPNAEKDRFDNIADELDAIVCATESATETLLNAAEEVSEASGALRDKLPNGEAAALVDRIDDRVGVIFEACSFQDITGQRISKIVNSMKYVDARVSAMADLWGPDSLSAVVVPEDDDRDADQQLLNGPALEGEGASQDDVDKLFDEGADQQTMSGPPPQADEASQDDIDKLFD